MIAFDNSTPICSEYNSVPADSGTKSNFFGKVGTFFNTAKDKMQITAQKVGSKIKEMELGDKLKNTGEKTVKIMKTTGIFVAEKGKEIYVIYTSNISIRN